MANNKIQLSDGTVLLDLSQDTVTSAAHIVSGRVGHLADGTQVTGTASSGIIPTGTLNITANDTYDVTNYASAVVNVPSSGVDIPTFTVTVNTDWTAVVSVSCNKTYAQCYEIASTDDYYVAAGIVTDGEYTYTNPAAMRFRYDIEAMSDSITVVVVNNAGEPHIEIVMLPDGTFTTYMPPRMLTTLNVTTNGTYNAPAGKFYNVVNVNVEGSGKNIQFYDGYDEVSTTTYSATDVSITVKKDGTYKCSWVAFRNTTSGMSGTRLYKNDSAVGSPHTNEWVRYNIMFCSETLTLKAGDVLVVRGRARSTSFIVLVGNLVIEEQ